MAQDIVVRYRAEVDDLLRKLDQISDAQKEVIQGETKANDEAKKAATTQAFAATKRNQLLELEKKKLAELQKAQKLAFDPKQIDAYNKKIQESNKNIELLTDNTKKQTSVAGGALKSFALGAGAAIAAAFSVDAIIQFGKASIDAFLDAEKNAERLKFAITTIGGESEAAFQRLIDQSEELQKITVFDDDSIQQAQAALAAFGLTADEIENIIPKLADFATVAGTDLNTAVSQLGAGLEGAGREFKKYGIEVSATASRQQNLNSILQGFGKFAGAAEDATKTLSGRLEQQRNIVADLQEQLGARLAPIFVRIKEVALEAALGLLGFNKAAEQLGEQTQNQLENVYSNLANRIKSAGGDVNAEFTKFLNNIESRTDQIEQKNNELAIRIQERLEIISRSTSNVLPQNDQLIKQLTEQIEKNKELISLENQNADAIKKTLDRLNAKSKLEEDSSEKVKEVNDARIAGSAKEVEQIKTLTAEYRDLLALFQLSPEQRQLLDLNISSEDVADFREQVAKIVAENPVEVPVTLEIPPDRVVEETGQKLGGSLVDSVLKRYAEEIATTQQLLGELTNLYAAFTDRQIEEINREKDARLASIDEQLKANDEALSLRRISEAEAVRNEKALIAEKLKAEETAAKKERELKRKQAIADKAAALITIAIQTAINVAKYVPPNPLIALAIALGAAQAAVVAAQPIPYAKGTKKAKGGLARVGEEGEEIMYVPNGTKVLPNKQTNRYGEVLDAMFDNRFDEYVNRRYIAPALMKEKARRETNQQRSFAENIVQSAMINPQTGLTYTDLEQIRKKGTKLTDDTIERLADALTRRTINDPYRR